jgi:hypothetical protein
MPASEAKNYWIRNRKTADTKARRRMKIDPVGLLAVVVVAIMMFPFKGCMSGEVGA